MFWATTIVLVAFICITNAVNSVAVEANITLTVETTNRVDTSRVATTIIDLNLTLVNFFAVVTVSVKS